MKSTAENIAHGLSLEHKAAIVVVAPPTALQTLDDVAAEIKREMNSSWLSLQYRDVILPMRTRAVALPVTSRGALRIEIQHTLLGIELKIGKHRVTCPDLATARYLFVWARVGCERIAVPYDISQISRVADELESALQRMLLLISHFAGERSENFRARLRTHLLREMRREVIEMGAGPAMPLFNQNTRQRPIPV